MATKTSKTVKKTKTTTTKTTKSTKAVQKINQTTKSKAPAKKKAAVPQVVKVRHVRVNPMSARRSSRPARVIPQFAYMKPPGLDNAFEVGDTVEVYCDHEKDEDRIRGWIKGIVVQVDNKMVAVQFRSNVFLTDGWMVPDRILWYPVTSDQIRATGSKKAMKRDYLLEF